MNQIEFWSVEILDANPRFLCGLGGPSKDMCVKCRFLSNCGAIKYMVERKKGKNHNEVK